VGQGQLELRSRIEAACCRLRSSEAMLSKVTEDTQWPLPRSTSMLALQKPSRTSTPGNTDVR
jgi:hypothetical protein